MSNTTPLHLMKQDIHNGPLQLLALLIIKLKEKDDDLDELIELAQKTSKELRQILKSS